MHFYAFLFQIVIGVLFITGVFAAFGRGMVLGELADIMEAVLPKWACKPIFSCPACMSSIWGTLVWFFTGGDIYHWAMYIFCLCGAMHIISISILSKNDRQ